MLEPCFKWGRLKFRGARYCPSLFSERIIQSIVEMKPMIRGRVSQTSYVNAEHHDMMQTRQYMKDDTYSSRKASIVGDRPYSENWALRDRGTTFDEGTLYVMLTSPPPNERRGSWGRMAAVSLISLLLDVKRRLKLHETEKIKMKNKRSVCSNQVRMVIK